MLRLTTVFSDFSIYSHYQKSEQTERSYVAQFCMPVYDVPPKPFNPTG